MSGTTYDEDIYMGIWINRSFGQIKGATLTLDRQRGALLIAFLALFVGAAGRAFWKIVRYGLHLSFSSESNLDGIHHQRQVFLRNSQIAQDAAANFLWARFAWKKKEKHVDRRFLPVALAAAVVAAAFVVSGIFSSRVTTDDMNEVLIAGRNCGEIHYTENNDTAAQAAVWTDYYSARTQKASEYLSYAYQCYRNPNSSKIKDCELYTKSTLPYTKNASAGCPFDPEMCSLAEGNLDLDSGYLDAYEYLGLTKGPRFNIRLRRQCAPVQTRNFTKIVTDKSDPSMQWMEYYYGLPDQANGFSYKLRYNVTQDVTSIQDFSMGQDYTITAPMQPVWSTKLARRGSITSLYWLQSTNIKNYAPVEDPWFKATVPKKLPLEAMVALEMPNASYYVPDEPAGVLGCASTLLFCNPSQPKDQACFNFREKGSTIAQHWTDKDDQAFIETYYNYIVFLFDATTAWADPYYLVSGLPSLMTRFTLNGLLQSAIIPPNRWQEEAEYMFQTNLAALQARMVEFASGKMPKDREMFANSCRNNIGCKRLCFSQKMRSPTYYSFSVLGIFIIIAVGTLILLLGTFTEALLDLLCKTIPALGHSRRLTYARLEWQTNTTVQLHRLAHEAVGSGTWSGGADSIPVADRGSRLMPYDISDPAHPRIVVDRVELKRRSGSYEGGSGEAGDMPRQSVFARKEGKDYKMVSNVDEI